MHENTQVVSSFASYKNCIPKCVRSECAEFTILDRYCIFPFSFFIKSYSYNKRIQSRKKKLSLLSEEPLNLNMLHSEQPHMWMHRKRIIMLLKEMKTESKIQC